MAGNSAPPNRRLAAGSVPKGYRVLYSETHKGGPDRATDEDTAGDDLDGSLHLAAWRLRKLSAAACVGKAMTSRIDGLSVSSIDQPVDADAEPAARRHAVFERRDVILVERLRLLVARSRAPASAPRSGRAGRAGR